MNDWVVSVVWGMVPTGSESDIVSALTKQFGKEDDRLRLRSENINGSEDVQHACLDGVYVKKTLFGGNMQIVGWSFQF